METNMIETPEHYQGKRTIEKQELIAAYLVKMGFDAGSAFDLATAIKYTDRAGEKDGESFEKDCKKAADYLYRGVMGWFPYDKDEQ